MQVDVLPGLHGTVSYSREEFLPTLFAFGLGDFLRAIEVIPTDDGVFDQTTTTIPNLDMGSVTPVVR